MLAILFIVLLPYFIYVVVFLRLKGSIEKMKDPIRKEFEGKEYIIYEMPCTVSREVLAQYAIANMPKLGDYETSEKLMLKVMKHVAVILEGGYEQKLTTIELINNHVPNALTLMKLEKEVIQYSNDFLADGEILNFLGLVLKVADKKITEILTHLLDVSLIQDEQLSEN
jgi:hypothetical protein